MYLCCRDRGQAHILSDCIGTASRGLQVLSPALACVCVLFFVMIMMFIILNNVMLILCSCCVAFFILCFGCLWYCCAVNLFAFAVHDSAVLFILMFVLFNFYALTVHNSHMLFIFMLVFFIILLQCSCSCLLGYYNCHDCCMHCCCVLGKLFSIRDISMNVNSS